MTTPPTQPPSCPRCGYDLSGAIAAWKLTCPLSTICTECGLTFELRLVLNERLRNQTDFFEASPSRSFRVLCKTTGRALRPWFFWRWVVMEHKPQFGWMVLGVLGGMLIVELACLLIALALVAVPLIGDLIFTSNQRYLGGSYAFATEQVLSLLTPWRGRAWGWPPASSGAFLLLGFLTQVFIPFTFILLPQTLRRARVLRGHLVRIGAWSFVALPLVLAVSPVLLLTVEAASHVGQWLGLVQTYGGIINNSVFFLGHAHHWIHLIALLAWTLLWYGLAVSRYLKLPTPWLIAAAMLTIASLSSLILCLLIPGVWYDLAVHL